MRKGNKNAVYLPFFFTLMVEAPHPDEAAAEHLVDAHAWTAPHYAAHWYAVLQKYVAHRADVTNGFRARMEALHAKSLRDIGIEVEAVLGAYPEGFADLVGFLALVKKPALIAAVPAAGSEASAQETHLAEGEQMDVEVEPESGWIKITDQSGKTRCPKRERVSAQRAVEKAQKDRAEGRFKIYIGDVLAIVWDDSERKVLHDLAVRMVAAMEQLPCASEVPSFELKGAVGILFNVFKAHEEKRMQINHIHSLFNLKTSDKHGESPFKKIDMLPRNAADFDRGDKTWGICGDILWQADWPRGAQWHSMVQYIHALKWAAQALAVQRGDLKIGQQNPVDPPAYNLADSARIDQMRVRSEMLAAADERKEWPNTNACEENWKAFMVHKHPDLRDQIYPVAGEKED